MVFYRTYDTHINETIKRFKFVFFSEIRDEYILNFMGN